MTEAQTAKLDQLIEVVSDRVSDADRDVTRAVADLRYALDNLGTNVHDLGELGQRVDRAEAKRQAQYEKLSALLLVRDAS